MAGIKTDEGREARERLLQYMRERQAQDGHLPTVSDLGRFLGVQPNGVRYHLAVLREEKKIAYDPKRVARTLRLRKVRSDG